MSYLLALDQGTTSSRAIIFNEHGEIQATEQQEKQKQLQKQKEQQEKQKQLQKQKERKQIMIKFFACNVLQDEKPICIYT